jgi:hypothetical protein
VWAELFYFWLRNFSFTFLVIRALSSRLDAEKKGRNQKLIGVVKKK